MTAAILNIATYRFTDLPEADLPRLKEHLHTACASRGLKGTILLATEGINLFLAGSGDAVEDFIGAMDVDATLCPHFASMDYKRSWSGAQPFGRLRVRIKREIIRMNHPAIRPARGRAPAVDALTVRRWLDAGHDDDGRPVVMLDTRNAFEVDHGAFDAAIDWRITKFSEFPDALRAHLDELRDKTVVSYCTGGIRCEKAAIFMREAGLDHVWQLDGGILRYFEHAGSAHYHGGCFVFDNRETLDAGLHPAAASPHTQAA